ncbi:MULTISPECIES: DUF1934 domain-containing protein [Dellaglioa]|uniref:DUF1934 domain-containing protein n=3 Tax=Dellaglioa TaxID=2767880 RepID=A0A0R1HS65_9LACO|nr:MULTISPECIES: DUF1934 domain-containing protein [Dellaglioa]KRK45431.1 hypothetical protein FC66_GL001394 [Dellaglioa algida DSM 15638]MCZ2491682.1 DUF1934 domain-containing protein [Dellaglioa carnosa]MCZ2493553.1 DUF1934 domain-containing protein [Dellaglioa carnosa]MCZ2494759.1 DUF1934 domain-containing protein [Dellaglioa carnosa]MDK1717561.1 DUF1934 domain-containing protein [Dellaglioa algida]
MAITLDKQIAIHLETVKTQEGEVERYVIETTGQLVRLGDGMYIRYKEEDEETGQTIPVTFKLQDDGEIQLTRETDAIRTKLIFLAQKKISGTYKTAYGRIPIEIETKRLKSQLKNQPISGSVEIDYRLTTNGELLGDYNIRLQFTA